MTKLEAIKYLKQELKTNTNLYTSLEHVSQSGMLRAISIYIATKKGIIINLTKIIAIALERRIHKKGGIIIGGCGMDMGFALVYDLSYLLYCPKKHNHNKAYKLKQIWL